MSIRICILSLPRTGSHYVAELLCKSYFEQNIILTNLQEPFNIDDPISIKLTDNILYSEYKSNSFHGEKQFDSVLSMINDRIHNITSCNSDQDIILRLFPFDYLESYINNIVSCLKQNNFKFVVLKRQNIERQLISYGRSIVTNKWMGDIDSSKIVYTQKAFNYMSWLYTKICKFDQIIQNLDIKHIPINYETSNNDIEQHLNMTVRSDVNIKKQSVNNPYDLISNADQVRVFIKNLLGVNFELC